MLKKRGILSLLFLIGLMVTPLKLQANGGIAVSGTFASYHYKLLPGEVIETPDVYVLFFNNFAVDIEVQLITSITNLDGSPTTVGDRVSFLLEETVVSIPANERIRIPIGMTVSEDAPAGEYRLGLAAEVIPDTIQGITVTGSAELRTRLTIFGEAGDLDLRSFDFFGEPLSAQLRLFRLDEGGTSPVRTVTNGVIIDRFVPGTYLVVGTFKEVEVLRETFTIVDREPTVLRLIAQTVFVESMSVTPLVSSTTGLLSRVRIDYTLRNIHTTVEDVRIFLQTTFEDEPLDLTQEAVIPFLPESVVNSSFNYLPTDGWQSGLYRFQIKAYQGPRVDTEDDVLLGVSNDRSLFVPTEFLDNPPLVEDPPEPDEPNEEEFSFRFIAWILSGFLFLLMGLGGFLLWRRRHPQNAVEYTVKRLRKMGMDERSEPYQSIVAAVQKRMGPGTLFLKETAGTKAYYEKVEGFLNKMSAFSQTEEPES
jgi:hypothetical protein